MSKNTGSKQLHLIDFQGEVVCKHLGLLLQKFNDVLCKPLLWAIFLCPATLWMVQSEHGQVIQGCRLLTRSKMSKNMTTSSPRGVDCTVHMWAAGCPLSWHRPGTEVSLPNTNMMAVSHWHLHSSSVQEGGPPLTGGWALLNLVFESLDNYWLLSFDYLSVGECLLF